MAGEIKIKDIWYTVLEYKAEFLWLPYHNFCWLNPSLILNCIYLKFFVCDNTPSILAPTDVAVLKNAAKQISNKRHNIKLSKFL